MNHHFLPYDAVLFDMDGVIADSEPHWDTIDATLLREHGIAYQGEHKHEVLGKGFSLALGFYKQHYNLAPELHELVERRRAIAADFYAEHILPFDDALRVLDTLRARGLKIGLATSSLRSLAQPFLEKHELAAHFDVIVTGDEVAHTKPAPDLYLKAAEKLNVEPARCLVVEDAMSGIQSGKAAGMQVVAIPDARFTKREAYEGHADFIVNHLAEVLPLALGESAHS